MFVNGDVRKLGYQPLYRPRKLGEGIQEEVTSELKLEGGRIKQTEQKGCINEANSIAKGKTAGQHKWDNSNCNPFSGKKGQLPDYVGQEQWEQSPGRSV